MHRSRFLVAFLGACFAVSLDAGADSTQNAPVPHTFTPGPDSSLTYDVYEFSSGGRKTKKLTDFLLLGCEIQSPGFERFTRYRLPELPYEFLFQLPPQNVKPGQSWAVDVTLGANGSSGSPFLEEGFCPQVVGAYTLVGVKTITSSSFHAPPRPSGASQMTEGGPPSISTFFRDRASKKAT